MTDMIPVGISHFTQAINYEESHEAFTGERERNGPFGVPLRI